MKILFILRRHFKSSHIILICLFRTTFDSCFYSFTGITGLKYISQALFSQDKVGYHHSPRRSSLQRNYTRTEEYLAEMVLTYWSNFITSGCDWLKHYGDVSVTSVWICYNIFWSNFMISEYAYIIKSWLQSFSLLILFPKNVPHMFK